MSLILILLIVYMMKPEMWHLEDSLQNSLSLDPLFPWSPKFIFYLFFALLEYGLVVVFPEKIK